MRTADLIDSLATELRPATRGDALAVLATATVAGAAVSLLAVVLIYGVQPGLTGRDALLPFAMKTAYALALGGLALLAASRLARPDGVFGGWHAFGWPVAALGAAALWWLATTPHGAMEQALLGGSWDRCPVRIAGLSLPVLAALAAAVRHQAPTDLRREGAAIGLTAGAAAAAVYALACTEDSPAFVLIWYSLGIALAAAVGAMLGPRLLRW